MRKINLIKKKIRYPKYLLIKIKKNLSSWTIWIFSTSDKIRKKLNVFSILLKPTDIILIYKLKKKNLYKTHLSIMENLFFGFSQKYTKNLNLKGVGYTIGTNKKENKLIFNLGFSHKVYYKIPKFLNISISKNNFNITGMDWQKVTQFATTLRKLKVPEIYKGKGIRFQNEIIKLKESKKSK